MKTAAILFDIDGTLLDTREFIFQAFEHTFRQHDISAIDRSKLAPLMGTPLEIVYATIVPSHDAKVLCRTHREFQRHHEELVVVFPGITDMLGTLRERGIKIAIITSRKEHVVSSLKHTKIFDLADVVVTGQDVAHHKPDPEGLNLALQKLTIQSHEALMVGDMPADIQAGKNAGVATVGVTWGFYGPAIQQAHPDHIIQAPADVLGLV